MKKYFFIILFLALLLAPSIGHAQVDQRCWNKDKCIKHLKDTFGLSEEEAATNFYSAAEHDDAKAGCKGIEDPTTKQPLGYCLPVGKTTTGVAFGGSRTFDNIGTFIQYIYRYGFIIGAIIAVLMLMLAGVMWIFSGGNQEVIGKARKRIGNAVIGLVLMALSYTILAVVNPYLINFRLPDVWLINTRGLAPQYCNDLNENIKIAKVGTMENKISQNNIELAQSKALSTPSQEARCGDVYIFQDGGSQTCTGNTCEEGHICAKQESKKSDKCYKGIIVGNIFASNMFEQLDSGIVNVFTEFWEYPWVEAAGDDIELYYFCNKGAATYGSLVGVDPNDDPNTKTQWYQLQGNPTTIINKAENECSSSGGLKGFLLNVEFNEDWDPTSEVIYLGYDNGEGIEVANGSNILLRFALSGIEEKYYITKEQLTQGIRLDIDASRTTDPD